jgi:leucine-zipper of insertion element IS481
VLASAGRGPAQTVARTVGVGRLTMWRWQQRFAEAGVEGLFYDRTRNLRKAPIACETTARLVALSAPSRDSLDRRTDISVPYLRAIYPDRRRVQLCKVSRQASLAPRPDALCRRWISGYARDNRHKTP